MMNITKNTVIIALIALISFSLGAQTSTYRKYLCTDDLLGGKPSGHSYYIEILWQNEIITEIKLTGAEDGSYERYWLKERVGGNRPNCEEAIFHNLEGVYWYFRFCHKPNSHKPELYMTRAIFKDGRWGGHLEDTNMGWVFKNLTRQID